MYEKLIRNIAKIIMEIEYSSINIRNGIGEKNEQFIF